MGAPRDADDPVEAARRAARKARKRKLAREREGTLGKRIEGLEGWLFIANDSNDVLGQHAGRVRLSDADLEAWAEVLRGRMALTEELGITWICTVVPDKEGVYAEFLPPEVEPAPKRTVHQFLDLAGTLGAPVMYPFAALVDAKGDPPHYSPVGTHWNHLGAFIAYRRTCEELRERGVDVSAVPEDRIRWREFAGKDGRRGVLADIEPQEGRCVFDNRVLNHGRAIVLERADGVGPSAVVFGESFTLHLLVFLKESFRRVVFVYTSTMARPILEREAPDVVLSYPTERFLLQVPSDDSAILQIAESARIKRETGVVPRPNRYLGVIPGAEETGSEATLPWPDLP